ncbi:MAG TPA: polysaccharide biosynthesis tyrosine autokinase [Chitinophagaceae bacterium]|nr:polysaccharide biosynthesis tyrosine autokinase [Chitinophagaceae bacterium]
MEGNQTGNKDLGNLSIKDLFFKYVRFLPVFLISVALCLLGAYLYLRYTTPIYRVTGTLSFKQDESNRSGGSKFTEIFNAKNVSDVQSEIEILKSQALMERVVDSVKLQTSYFAVGKIKTLNIYTACPFRLKIIRLTDSFSSFRMNFIFPSENEFRVNKEPTKYKFGDIFGNAYGLFTLSKISGGVKGKEYNVEWKSTQEQAANYAPIVRVAPKIMGTSIYNIQIDYTNSALAADIVNNLMLRYKDASIDDKNATIKQRLDYIIQQLGRIEQSLDSIEAKRIAYVNENNLSGYEGQMAAYFEEQTEADQKTKDLKHQIVTIDLVKEYLEDGMNNYELTPSALSVTDQTLSAMVNSYNVMQLERKKMLEQKIPEENPQIQAKNAELEKLRKNILETLKIVKVAYNSSIDDFYRRGTAAVYKQKEMPAKIQRLLEMERERDSKLALYKFLQEQREETAMQQAATVSGSKVLGIAYPTNAPIKPNRRAIQLLAIILGLGLPAMYIFFQEIINDKVNTRHDIEKLTDASVLGEVGHSYSSSSMIVSKTNRSMVSEQFRIIRSNLQYILNKVEKPIIMVTSSFSAEGKSFITTNLGGVMALAGKKVVMLEFDIRKPKLFSGMKLGSKQGITNFLVGKAQMTDLPIKIPGYENLYGISCGPVPPNPAELLLDSRVEEMFEWLKANFDVILVDTAPVGMVSDAMTLGKFADTTLYIVRQGHTYKKQISLIDEFYHENRLPKISIVINDVKLKPGYGYYGYGRYGYGYGYGGGYYEIEEGQDTPKRIFSFDRLKTLFKRR